MKSWVNKQSTKIDTWNDTVFRKHNSSYVVELKNEITNNTATAGI